MKTPNKIMVDIETLSLQRNAVVLTVGVVLFNESIISKHYWKLCQYEQAAYGRHINIDTLKWWRKQSDEAYNAAFNDRSITSLDNFCAELNDLYNRNSCKEIWARGSDFDIPILESLVDDSTAYTHAWKYSAKRDERTLRSVMGLPEPKQEGAHNALCDAVYQTERVIECLNWIKNKKGDNGNV